MAPAADPMRRFLYPPSTAATFNMVAVAAQAARIWRVSDPVFAARALAAARRGWDAAGRVPDLYASSDFSGSGGYGDKQIADERFWAAAQMFVTTGEAGYLQVLMASPFLHGGGVDLSWGGTELAGLLTLATVPSVLPRRHWPRSGRMSSHWPTDCSRNENAAATACRSPDRTMVGLEFDATQSCHRAGRGVADHTQAALP